MHGREMPLTRFPQAGSRCMLTWNGCIPGPDHQAALPQGVPHGTAVPSVRPQSRHAAAPSSYARPGPLRTCSPDAPGQGGRAGVPTGRDRVLMAGHANILSARPGWGDEGCLCLLSRPLPAPQGGRGISRGRGYHDLQVSDRPQYRHRQANGGPVSLDADCPGRAQHQDFRRQGPRAAAETSACIPGRRIGDILPVPRHHAARGPHRARCEPRGRGGSLPAVAVLPRRGGGCADQAGLPPQMPLLPVRVP